MRGTRTVLLASPRSFCAGVERAIETVERLLDRDRGPVYVRKQIVHHTPVVADLAARGAVFVDELEEVPAGAPVVFPAHGVSPAVVDDAAARGLAVTDATCPLVSTAHAQARRFVRDGYTVVLVGHAGHEETDGTLGEAPDAIVLVQTPDEVAALDVPDPHRVAYLTQTTLAVDETAAVVDALRRRFPDLRGPGSDGVCHATTNRRAALAAVADRSDLVLVVGSATSSNSVRLVELARRRGCDARLVPDASAVRPEWLDGVVVVGVTAGASAPPELVGQVVEALRGCGPVVVEEVETARETVRFPAPRP